MSEKDQVQELIGYTKELLEQSVDFTKDQSSLLAQEVIDKALVSSGLGIGINLIVIIAVSIIIKKGYDRSLKDDTFDPFGVYFIGGGFLILSTIMLCVNTYHLLTVIVAPRVYILDYLRQLL